MSYKNNAISSDDPQAVEKLTEKLNTCEKEQQYMKSANAHYRKNGTMKGFDNISDEQAAKMDESIQGGYSWAQVPYPSYMLTNNNAEIRRLKKRIEQLSTDKAVGFTGWKFPGGEAVANSDNNRLQLLFDEKPSDEQRRKLKANGFRWAPSEGAWQRQLNSNAIYAANRIDFIQPENGQKPTELQPKIQKKNEPER